MVFLIIFLFPLVLLPNYLFSDGSVGWHFSIGDYILKHGQVPYHDFLSYTFNGKPWVAFYWLFDLALSACHAIGGMNGAAVFCSAIIAGTFLLVYERMRREGCDALLAALLVLIAASASTVHWLARPLLAAFLGVYVFSTTLEDFHRRRISVRRMLITLGVTTLVWINSHPSALMGIASLAIYWFSAIARLVLSSTPDDKKEASFEALWLTIAGAVSIIATLINPWGFDLYKELLPGFGFARLNDNVDEFRSPIFHGAVQASSLELIFFALFLGLFLHRKRVSFPQLLNTLAFAHLSLSSVRNIPVFVITALPLIGELYNGLPRDFVKNSANGAAAKVLENWKNFQEKFNAQENACSMHIVPVLAIVVYMVAAMNGGNLLGNQVFSCNYDDGRLPVATLEYIKKNKLPPEHGFNQVNWGGLISYEAKIPIFIDDRATFFGEEFYWDYGKVISLAPGWQDFLDKHAINWIIFPKESSFADALKESGKWKIVSEDKAAYLFERITSK